MAETEDHDKRLGRIIRYGLLFLWVGVIFYLSSDAGSTTQTSRFIRPLLEFLFPGASTDTLTYIHGLIRKGAHLSVYGVLGLLGAHAFCGSAVRMLRKYWYLTALWLALIIATADELNQSLLSSRTGTPSDVALDLAGAASAVVVYALVFRRGS